MKTPNSAVVSAILAACALVAVRPALAAVGAQANSFSPENAGMAGASIANPADTVAAADNPAGMSKVGNRYDIGMMLIISDEKNTFLSSQNKLSGLKFFPNPAGGYNRQIDDRTTVGISIYGQGAGALYDQPILPMNGLSHAKALFMAEHFTPTVTRKLTDTLAVGASLDMVLAGLYTKGLVAPNGQPIAPDLSTGIVALPNHGLRSAFGVGVKIGVLWDVLPTVAVGASYSSKVSLSRFSGYNQDVLAGSNGHIDLPEEYGVGVKWKPIPQLTLAADYLRINWANARAFGDPNTFGYSNVNAGRFGVAYDLNSHWTVRTGFQVASNWSNSQNTLNNVLGPVTQNREISAGFTYHLDKAQDISFAIGYSLPNKVQGTGHSTGTNIDTSINFCTVQYSHRF